MPYAGQIGFATPLHVKVWVQSLLLGVPAVRSPSEAVVGGLSQVTVQSPEVPAGVHVRGQSAGWAKVKVSCWSMITARPSTLTAGSSRRRAALVREGAVCSTVGVRRARRVGVAGVQLFAAGLVLTERRSLVSPTSFTTLALQNLRRPCSCP